MSLEDYLRDLDYSVSLVSVQFVDVRLMRKIR